MTAAIYIFWISFFILFYTYFGYGLVLWCLWKVGKKRVALDLLSDAALPEVTVIVAAYNEEPFIEDKIKNTLALDYPKEKIKFFLVTDGSTDATVEIARRYSLIKVFHENKRMGKIHAVNRVMKLVDTPVVVFSDANTALNKNAIKQIVRHYQDQRVGGVAGEKRIIAHGADSAAASGEGIYWRYESALKKMDSDIYSVVGAAGELFSLRTSLFEEPPDNTIIEDFYVSLRIASRGYRFAYEPEAYAIETASISVQEEWKRKVRITAGGFQAMIFLRDLLNPFRHGLLSFQYISHRVLRWTLAPLSLLLLLLSNIALAIEAPFYAVFLLLQVLFYLVGLLGHILRTKKIKMKGFFVPYYFLVMNVSVFAGLVKFISGKQSVVWEKSQRADLRDK